MKSNIQYDVFDIKGLKYGYFLDNRLYEYFTATCVGVLDEDNNVTDSQDVVIGHVDGMRFIKNDQEEFDIKPSA